MGLASARPPPLLVQTCDLARNRKRAIRYDVQRYRERWRIEAAFCRLKDFRRIARDGPMACALAPLFHRGRSGVP
jgi:transposase